ncbi:PREDICTED: uncharacterized protein LOC108358588 [Rhagoletis zephyria]|uniref:uncharacterized protein LOC108358588 n=1 Tax=Rhagoletis zephyria TaxID=28612 RepID=UPI0008118DD8|nr:PREDICTED: uncharacterized protein LOC108358588 [Rhagoletis zephyria]
MAANNPPVMHSPVSDHTEGVPPPIPLANPAPGLKVDSRQNSNLLDTSQPGTSAHNVSATSMTLLSGRQENDRSLPGNTGFSEGIAEDRSRRSNGGAPAGDSWVGVLHQLLRTSQEEMRAEMRTMRENMNALSAVVTASQTAPSGPRDFASIGRNSTQATLNNRPNFTTNIVMKPQDWKVSYDGTGSVSDFLFKLNTLYERTQCTDELLMASFHLFLSGRAEEWYWLFTKQNPDVTYPFLCYSIKREFGTLKSDHEIMMEISMRRQKANESYDMFHTDILALTARLREPMSENLLMDILKRNVNSSLKWMLFNAGAQTLHDLRDVARNGEQFLKKTRSLVPNYSGRHVNETMAITPDEWTGGMNGEVNPQVEALNFQRARKPDYSGIQYFPNEDEPNFHQLTPDQKIALQKVVQDFPSFETLGLGQTSLVTYHIDTADAVPIKSKHFPLSPPRQAEAYSKIERLFKMGVIEESNSPWCSPVVLVRKPRKVRLCIDSRKVNAVTKKDSYPLPHINGLLSGLNDTYLISGIDLKDAFLQIKLTESSKEKTAFAVPNKPLYHFKVMCFGPYNGPQTMSPLMDKAIPSLLRENVFVYLDAAGTITARSQHR